MPTPNYQIKLADFEGPFDLLLFFIERDELDIYNIPIAKIMNDFLSFIQQSEKLNIELSSEFILFIATLMRIKAKMLLPRKELDADNNEIDPRQELVNKLLSYKKFKSAAVEMAAMEAIRMLMLRRGNAVQELSEVGEASGEGSEIQTITMFKLMKAFERVINRLQERQNKPMHTVVQYRYTMEASRDHIFSFIQQARTASFEQIFEPCQDRIQALFFFLSLLELAQQRFMTLLVGDGKNNFVVAWNNNREEALQEQTIVA